MRYLLLIYGDEKAWAQSTAEERAQSFQEYNDYTKWLTDQGWYRGGDPLEETDTAKTVRVRDGEATTTDGPFAETKEQLGGYYAIEVDTEEQALEAARRLPGSKYGSIEARRVASIEGM